VSERTEEPTARRLTDARAEGQVPRSIELNAAVAMIIGAFLLRGPGRSLYEGFNSMLIVTTSTLKTVDPTLTWLKEYLIDNAIQLVPGVGMILAGLLVAGVATTVMQTGFLWASKRIGFDLSRVNPLSGIRRLISLQGLVELLKAILKLVIIGLVAYSFIRSHWSELVAFWGGDLQSTLAVWAHLAYSLVMQIGLAYFVLAAMDYAYQRWQTKRALRMTKEEVKEDRRRSEGDPFLRSRIRAQQRRLARQRMMADVKKADVVITNPTHLAVAVGYDAETMRAPKVLAKGAYKVAERIIEIAREFDIPILQNIPLARALYSNVDLDQEIPAEFYIAMAEVLAYVYGLRNGNEGALTRYREGSAAMEHDSDGLPLERDLNVVGDEGIAL
jgi:flagellar biosynthetic protein FlhB